MALWISFTARLVIAFSLISSIWKLTRLSPRVTREASESRWRVDLRSAIGRNGPVKAIDQGQHESSFMPEVSLWFINNNTIAATFVVHKTDTEPRISIPTGFDRNLPLQLRAIFLDAHTGKITGVSDLPTDSRRSLIIDVYNGKFVTLRGTNLTLYSPVRVALKNLTLPATGLVEWLPRPSPTGQNILFFSTQFGKASLIWVDVDAFKIIGSWEDDLNGELSISDESIATSTCWSGFQVKSITYNDNGGEIVTPGGRCNSEVKVRGLATGWKTVAPGEAHQFPQFVNENMLFIPGKMDGKIMGIDGRVLFDQPRIRQSFGCWETGALPASDGRRFVIPSCELKGAMPTLDIGGHLVLRQIAVYDISPHIQWRMIDVKGQPMKNQMKFAISPDGSQLAILDVGTLGLQLIDLPPD